MRLVCFQKEAVQLKQTEHRIEEGRTVANEVTRDHFPSHSTFILHWAPCKTQGPLLKKKLLGISIWRQLSIKPSMRAYAMTQVTNP